MTIPQSVLDSLSPEAREAVLAAQAKSAPAAAATATPTAVPPAAALPEVDGWTPDFNAARSVGTFSDDDKTPWVDWQDIFLATVVLDVVKHVHGRKGTFYLAEFTVAESNSDKYAPGTRWAKSFHYFARPRCEDEANRNKRSFRELGDLAAAAFGVRGGREFDANKHIGELLTQSQQMPSLGRPFVYEQAPYTSKAGRSGVGSEFKAVK